MIKPFQATGLLGERHIEKKLLDLPVPHFDGGTPQHRRLAELGQTAHENATAIVKSPDFLRTGPLARQRAFIRHHLKDTLAEIDSLAKKIL